MAEYIEREALLNALGFENTKRAQVQPDSTFGIILSAPAADVAPVRHGRWILVDKSYGEYECSVCHARDSNCSDYYGVHDVTGQDWCPYCGAIMKLKDEAE